jgi:hypothetical protein
MSLRFPVLLALLSAASYSSADQPDLAFKASGEGIFEFDTGVLKGRLKLDGKFQGLYPLVDSATGKDLSKPPGVFSLYRLFTTNRRFGNAARDWPTRTRLLAGGAVEAVWPVAEEHPFEMTAVYRWSATDTLDLDIAVKPDRDMPDFELFMSSYFTEGFLASVYLRRNAREHPGFVLVDRPPGSAGGYVMFPRDQDALRLITDDRWTIPPSPVDWALQRWLAAPVAIRRDEEQGWTAVMMCPPEDCFAISSPWNPVSADAGGYRSLYLSLFGYDLKAGQSARVRCRLIMRRNLSNDQAADCYQEYLATQH